MSDQTTGAAVSDYDAIGGGPAVSAVVNDFYVRVLADPQLVPYFEGVDMARLKRHQVLLVTQVLGGPAKYDGRSLPDDIILRAIAVVASTEPDIVESRAP